MSHRFDRDCALGRRPRFLLPAPLFLFTQLLIGLLGLLSDPPGLDRLEPRPFRKGHRLLLPAPLFLFTQLLIGLLGLLSDPPGLDRLEPRPFRKGHRLLLPAPLFLFTQLLIGLLGLLSDPSGLDRLEPRPFRKGHRLLLPAPLFLFTQLLIGPLGLLSNPSGLDRLEPRPFRKGHRLFVPTALIEFILTLIGLRGLLSNTTSLSVIATRLIGDDRGFRPSPLVGLLPLPFGVVGGRRGNRYSGDSRDRHERIDVPRPTPGCGTDERERAQNEKYYPTEDAQGRQQPRGASTSGRAGLGALRASSDRSELLLPRRFPLRRLGTSRSLQRCGPNRLRLCGCTSLCGLLPCGSGGNSLR